MTIGGGRWKRSVAITGALILLGGSACSDVAIVDEVTIVNDTEYTAHVLVTDGNRDGWLGLTTVEGDSTKLVERVIDQGEVWIFRFDYAGKYEEEIEFTRHDLERSEWTIEVPQSFEERLRELDVPPPP